MVDFSHFCCVQHKKLQCNNHTPIYTIMHACCLHPRKMPQLLHKDWTQK